MLYTVIYFLCPAGSTAGVETAGAAIVNCPRLTHKYNKILQLIKYCQLNCCKNKSYFSVSPELLQTK